MRNLLVFITAILAIIHIGCGPTQFENIEHSISAQNSPELNEEQKQWLLALSAIIMEVNQSSHVTLEVKPISEESIQKYKMILHKWWGITNRYELLDAIRRLEKYGTSATYLKLLSFLKANEGKDFEELLGQSPTFEDHMYLVSLHKNNESKKDIDIIAWDWGRAAALIRWGYQVGYLSETEAWNMLLYFGRLTKGRFTSWQDYGASYAYGRVFWASGVNKSDEYIKETQETLNILFSDDGLWRKLRWNVAL